MTLKIMMFTLILSLLTTCLSGCSCEHDWQGATCELPQICSKCGVQNGTPLGHNWQSATCELPQICSKCSVQNGTPLGHNWKSATCDTPKTCINCKKTQGEPIEHYYEEGVCVYCEGKDSNYIDFNKIGYKNFYGMTLWVDIDGYSMSKNAVYSLNDDYFAVISYGTTKFTKFGFNLDEVKNVDKLTLSYLEKIDPKNSSEVYVIVSNDVMKYTGVYDDVGPVTIVERVVDGNKLVIKTIDETSGTMHEKWYVPADLLNFSSTFEDKNKDGNSRFWIHFK